MNKLQTINIVCDSFLPQRKPGALRIATVIDVLSNDAKVNVIFLVQAGERFELEKIPQKIRGNENIQLHPIEINTFSKSNFLKRLVSETQHAYKLLQKSNSLDCELQIVSFPILMLLPVSMLFNYFGKKRRNILEVRDLIWKYLEFKTGVVNRILYHSLRVICEVSVSSFDEVVTVTKAQKKSIEYITNKKVTYIPNGIDRTTLDELGSIPPRVSMNRDKVVITYAGAIGYPQNLEVLVQATEILNRENIDVLVNIIGDGPEREGLLQLCKMKKIENIIFPGAVSFEKLKEFYQKSDVLYAQLRDIPSMRTAEPTKIFEYIAAGRSIIFGIKGDGRILLERFQGHKVIQPDDSKVLADAIKKINTTQFEEMVLANKTLLSEEYAREVIALKFKAVCGL